MRFTAPIMAPEKLTLRLPNENFTDYRTTLVAAPISNVAPDCEKNQSI